MRSVCSNARIGERASRSSASSVPSPGLTKLGGGPFGKPFGGVLPWGSTAGRLDACWLGLGLVGEWPVRQHLARLPSKHGQAGTPTFDCEEAPRCPVAVSRVPSDLSKQSIARLSKKKVGKLQHTLLVHHALTEYRNAAQYLYALFTPQKRSLLKMRSYLVMYEMRESARLNGKGHPYTQCTLRLGIPPASSQCRTNATRIFNSAGGYQNRLSPFFCCFRFSIYVPGRAESATSPRAKRGRRKCSAHTQAFLQSLYALYHFHRQHAVASNMAFPAAAATDWK